MEFGNRKNLKSVLEVYETLKNQYEIPHNLVLVGSNEGDIFEKVPFSEDEITITGYVSEGELKYAYENADVFLFPSMHEGFGLPPLEAMACGTPVVASSAASLPEVVGDAGLLVDPDNTEEFAASVLKLLEDEKCQDELITNGRKQVQNYTWEKTKDRLADTFSMVLNGSHSHDEEDDK